MKVGFIGLGQLGAALAVSIALKGHNIMAYDINPDRMSLENLSYFLREEEGPFGKSTKLSDYVVQSGLTFGSLKSVCDHADLIFLCINTPHDFLYGGHALIPDDAPPMDFDYTNLMSAVKNLNEVTTEPKCISIISTVLPNTIENVIKPIASPLLKISYSAQTPAHGTFCPDFYFPEFYMIGCGDPDTDKLLTEFYTAINPDVPIVKLTIQEGELLKILYNLFVTTKITFSNLASQMCTNIPNTNVDNITNALKLCTKRLISPSYLSGGMVDSCGCHPRKYCALV